MLPEKCLEVLKITFKTLLNTPNLSTNLKIKKRRTSKLGVFEYFQILKCEGAAPHTQS